MIVEVLRCPGCGKQARIADIDLSDDSLVAHKKKIVVLCLECNEAPVMNFLHTEILDEKGNVGTVIV